MATNMGTIVHLENYVRDGSIIAIRSGTNMGEPFAERMVVELGPNGPVKIAAHRFGGTRGAEVSFKAEYAKAD